MGLLVCHFWEDRFNTNILLGCNLIFEMVIQGYKNKVVHIKSLSAA